jgi:hypothetical protein
VNYTTAITEQGKITDFNGVYEDASDSYVFVILVDLFIKFCKLNWNGFKKKDSTLAVDVNRYYTNFCKKMMKNLAAGGMVVKYLKYLRLF